MMGPSIKVTVKSKDEALREALREARIGVHSDANYAKHKVIGYDGKLMKRVYNLDIDPDEEFKAMIKEFLPEYLHLL